MGNSRIAKNAIFLYLRMFLIMGVSLYTSRIILEGLGISDFGIYNIIGGIVAMMGFINGAMAVGTQRFLSYDIGLNNHMQIKSTFNTALTIHLIIGAIIILLGETIGLWYINYKMVYPEDRTFAVNIVYQFSLYTLFLNIVQIPYNSLILAREQMNVYAYVSIFEAMLKLLVAFLIIYTSNDKLIYYSILTFISSLMIRIIYQVYCRMNFEESRYEFEYDKLKMREMLSFSGWNLFGALSTVGKNQGVNILLNLFFGTIINAAFGIVIQVQSAVTQFVNSFQSALNPQIIQQFALKEKDRSLSLIFAGSKYSFYLLLFIVTPIYFNSDLILKIWLGSHIPDYSNIFLKFSLINLLIECISGPIMTGILASGKIRMYQIVIGGINLIIPFIIYFFFLGGFSPEVSFQILVVFSLLSLIFRILFLKRFYDFSLIYFLKSVIIPIVFSSFITILIVLILNQIIVVNSFINFVLWILCFSIILGVLMFFFGIEKSYRVLVLNRLRFR